MPYNYESEAGREAAKKYRLNHYYNNKEQYYRRNQEKKTRMREHIAVVKSVPCQDCGGIFPPYCMDFHHRDPEQKSDTIGPIINRGSWTKLNKEIEKCDIICAVCHRIRHHRSEAEVAG